MAEFLGTGKPDDIKLLEKVKSPLINRGRKLSNPDQCPRIILGISKYVYTSDNMSLKRVVQSVYGQWRLTQAKEVSELK